MSSRKTLPSKNSASLNPTQEINIHNVLNRLEPIGEEASQVSSSIKHIQQQIEGLHNKRNSDGISQVQFKRKGKTQV